MKEPLHERYAALFGLRNRRGAEAVAAIIASLQCESALLKHEVCITNGFFLSMKFFWYHLRCKINKFCLIVSTILTYAFF